MNFALVVTNLARARNPCASRRLAYTFIVLLLWLEKTRFA
jgi:hypothetical protein